MFTVHAEVVVQDLEQGERIPGVWQLLGKDGVHVDGEKGPKDLGVLDEQVAEPGERLNTETKGKF